MSSISSRSKKSYRKNEDKYDPFQRKMTDYVPQRDQEPDDSPNEDM